MHQRSLRIQSNELAYRIHTVDITEDIVLRWYVNWLTDILGLSEAVDVFTHGGGRPTSWVNNSAHSSDIQGQCTPYMLATTTRSMTVKRHCPCKG